MIPPPSPPVVRLAWRARGAPSRGRPFRTRERERRGRWKHNRWSPSPPDAAGPRGATRCAPCDQSPVRVIHGSNRSIVTDARSYRIDTSRLYVATVTAKSAKQTVDSADFASDTMRV
eukprot:1195051-Prorocentrum_minimum.AAC.3